jgi:hypothetical protein
MAADPNSIEAFKNIVLLTDKIMKAQKKINPRFDLEISKSLPAAIKDKNGPMIELYLTTLKTTLKDIENSLDDTRTALLRLGDLQRGDEEFVSAHLADMDKLTTKITGAQSSLTKQFEEGKKFQTQAEKALDAQQNTQEKAFRELAELDKWINDETKDLREAFTKSDQIASKAQAAFDSRDAKILADAKKSMAALQVDALEAGYGLQEPKITDFIKDIQASGFEADAIAELKKGAEETLSKHRANKTYVDELKAQQKLVADFEIAEIDVKKAVKALSLDPKAEAKLAKILNGPGPAMEKGLDALAKELKLKSTGKQMLATLKKAGVI